MTPLFPYNERKKIAERNLYKTNQHHKKILYAHRPSEARFPNKGLLKIKENSQCGGLTFNA